MHPPVWIIAISWLLLHGAVADEPERKPENVVALSKPSAGAPTVESCTKFAKELEQHLIDGDFKAFNKAINWDALLKNAMRGIDAPLAVRQGFIQGVKESTDLAKVLAAAVANGGSYTFLRVHGEPDAPRLLFRLQGDDGINYHDLMLRKKTGGDPEVVDLDILGFGDLMSASIRRMWIPVAAHENRSLARRLVGWESEFIKGFPTFERMIAASKSGDHAAVLDLYRQLPLSLQKNKTSLIMRLQAASVTSDEEHAATIELFRKHHPKDRGIDFVLIDYHTMKGEYDEAVACAQRFSDAIGGDVALEWLKAALYVEAGDLEQAKAILAKTVASDPEYDEAYWTLVDITLREKDFAETARLLDTLESTLGWELHDLSAAPEYSEFVKSPEYEAWMKKRSEP